MLKFIPKSGKEKVQTIIPNNFPTEPIPSCAIIIKVYSVHIQ